MMRTAAVALLACALCACTRDQSGEKRPTRVTCVESGRTVVDDFSNPEDQVVVRGSNTFFYSNTQKGRIDVTGTCVSRPTVRPAGWKPTYVD